MSPNNKEMTTVMSVEDQVSALLNKMALAVDDITLSKVASQRMNAKHFSLDSMLWRITFSAPSPMRSVVHIYAKSHIKDLYSRLISRSTLTPVELREYSVELLLWAMVQSYNQDLPSDQPLLHHWLPLCYTKRFASQVMTSRRGAIINQIRFDVDGSVASETSVRDTFFAHTNSKNGYYPAPMEQFFGQIESRYASVLDMSLSRRSAWKDVVCFAFFALQTARNPINTHFGDDPVFATDHRERIVPDMFKALESYKTPYIRYTHTDKNLLFSPFFPPRIRKTAGGVTAVAFHLSTHNAMVLTDFGISKETADSIVENNMKAMVHHAGCTGRPLYGVKP